MSSTVQRVYGVFAILFYILTEFVFADRLSAIHPDILYAFEIGLIAVSVVVFGSRVHYGFTPKLIHLGNWVSVFVLGLGANKLIGPLGLQSPFDLGNPFILFFLVFYAPIVEELIFRMSLWQSIEGWVKNRWVTWVLTSLLFAYAHFQAYFFIEPAYKPFVLYQTAYTFAFALYLGYQLKKTGSVFFTLLLHFFFNLGFAMGGL